MNAARPPGLEGIQKSTGVDVAGAVIEHIERELQHQPAPDPETDAKQAS